MICFSCLFTWQNLTNLIFFIGTQHLLIYLYENLKSPFKILKSMLTNYINPDKKQSLKQKYGDWAVVTGSTDGIGKAYAKQLARRGINIALISRSKDKLIQTAKEIENEFNVETKWIVADFSKKNIYQNIKDELADIEVGILVNNVGTMFSHPDEFANQDEEDIWNMLMINMSSCTMMTRMLVNGMKENKRGAIVNISSLFNICFAPYSNIYAATKVYMKYFSKALEWELAPYNITVQLVSPGAVPTNLTKQSDIISKKGLLSLSVDLDTFAKSAVFTLGKTNETTGSVYHGIQMAMSNLFPMEVNAWISMKLMKFLYKR